MLITAFYIVAPKGFTGTEVLFQPIPYALATWTFVLIVRLVLVSTHSMRGILVHIFIVLDMILLLTLIGSYSVQYQTTFALSLKAPTFIFLLFFILLRGLRSKYQYIITGFISAVIGWGALVYVAYMQGPVTHSFYEYTTLHTVLLGAEIEKILALTACTALVFIIVSRSSRVLTISHQQRDIARNLSLFFSQNVVRRIAAENEVVRPGRGEERQGAIMSIDIRDFTKFSAGQDPTDVARTLSLYQTRVISAMRDNSGSIDKFMGDGILAHFGIADDSLQFAANALRAAEQIIAKMDAWNVERTSQGMEHIRVGIGVAIGKVMFGTVGDESRLEFTVIGNAVNISSKLEKETKKYPGRILTTRVSYDMARQQRYTPRYIPFLIKQRRISGGELVDVVTLLTKDEKEMSAKEDKNIASKEDKRIASEEATS